MSDLSQLQSAIARNLDRRVHKILITRGNELHCQIERGAAPRLAGLLRAQFHAELILMVANDRRADKGVFEMHYLFANARENWFLHATEELAPEEPIISLATFYYPASRFEREIQDLFGIQAIGHPDPRPLVRHAFWPKDYFPLRKDAVEVAEKALDAVLDRMKNEPVPAQELEKAKNQVISELVVGRRTVQEKADAIGQAAVLGKNPDLVNLDLDRYLAVTPADIQRVAQKYFDPKQRTVLIIETAPAAAGQK